MPCFARQAPRLQVAALAALLLLGCGGGGSASHGTIGDGDALGAVPGPWVIPAEVLAAGDAQFVENTQAGPWSGERAQTPGFT